MNKHKYISFGTILFIIFAVLHLSSRSIAWPRKASWGTQIEATSFYSMQLAIENVTFLLMALSIGIILIGLWEVRVLYRATGHEEGHESIQPIRYPEGLNDDELVDFQKWLAEDLARKYLPREQQLSSFRKSAVL